MAITRRAVLSAVTGAGAVSEAFEPACACALAVYAQSGDGVSAGAVQLEEAPSKGSTAWAPVGAPVPVVTGAAAATTYAGRVIADGAVNYWRLGEQSGTVARDEIGGKDGTISGSGVTLNQPGALVDGNRAMKFDSTGTVQVPSVAIPSSVTIEGWMFLPAILDSHHAMFSTRGSGSGFLLGYLGTSGVATAVVYADNSTPVQIAGGPVTAGAWIYLVLTRNPTASIIYVNAVPTPRAQTHAPFSWVVALSDPGNGNPFPGLLDEIAVYPYELTPAQIAAHYQAGLGQFAALAGARVTVPKAVYGALRLRVSTPIAGGPVTAWVVAGDIPAEEAA